LLFSFDQSCFLPDSLKSAERTEMGGENANSHRHDDDGITTQFAFF
jgi:hypothetical protein